MSVLFSGFALLARNNEYRIRQSSSASFLSPTPIEEMIITEEDKKSILLSILEKTDFQNSDDTELEKSGSLYLSTENLPNSFVIDKFPKLKGILKIVFITPDNPFKISENKTNYWEFRDFEVKKNKVSVSLMIFYADGNSPANEYEYEKTKDGKWKGKDVGWSSSAH